MLTVENLKDKEFITYGISFNQEKFKPAFSKDAGILNKPSGGLWSSPVGSEFGWKDWCKAEDFRGEDYFKIWTKFNLSEDAKIVVIDSYFDLICLLKEYGSIPEMYKKCGLDTICLDFEKLIKDFDGIYLTDNGNRECHLPFMSDSYLPWYSDLNSWDCESMVLFRNDKMIITEIVD